MPQLSNKTTLQAQEEAKLTKRDFIKAIFVNVLFLITLILIYLINQQIRFLDQLIAKLGIGL